MFVFFILAQGFYLPVQLFICFLEYVSLIAVVVFLTITIAYINIGICIGFNKCTGYSSMVAQDFFNKNVEIKDPNIKLRLRHDRKKQGTICSNFSLNK